jgi:ribosomal-protein-alanine N-acetyltransferase
MLRLIQPDRQNAPALAGLAARAFDGPASAWKADHFLALAGQAGAVVIAEDTLCRGMIVLRMAADEAEILDFGVVPGCRRTGLGGALLRFAEAHAKAQGAASVFLEVAIDNAPARALYRKHGYAQIGERRGYFLRPDGTRADALVLKKGL